MIYLVTPPTGDPIAFLNDMDASTHIRNLGFEWNIDDNFEFDGVNFLEDHTYSIWRNENNDVLLMTRIKLIGDQQ